MMVGEIVAPGRGGLNESMPQTVTGRENPDCYRLPGGWVFQTNGERFSKVIAPLAARLERDHGFVTKSGERTGRALHDPPSLDSARYWPEGTYQAEWKPINLSHFREGLGRVRSAE